MRLADATAVLRERNLALLLSSATISSLGSGMAQVALAFAVLRFGNASDLGFVLLAREIPNVVFLLLGGVWADRISRKRLLVLGALLQGATQAATAALLITHHANVWNVAALQIGFGIAMAFTRPASTGLIPQAVRPDQLQLANALNGLGRSTTRVLGPALGGLIVVASNPGWALVADAASFIVAAALTNAMRVREGERGERRRVVHELREGWSEFIARDWVWTMVASFGLFQMTLFPALLVLGPVVAKQHLGGAVSWGLILAFQSVGSLVGGAVALRLRPRRPLVASALLMLPTAAMLALLGAAAPVWALCAISLVALACVICGDIIWTSTFQQHIPEHLMSRISSFDWLGSIALNPIGYALVGPLSNVIGIPAVLYGAAAINACVTLVLASLPAVRRMRAEPALA